jgi:hypothetical protein
VLTDILHRIRSEILVRDKSCLASVIPQTRSELGAAMSMGASQWILSFDNDSDEAVAVAEAHQGMVSFNEIF